MRTIQASMLTCLSAMLIASPIQSLHADQPTADQKVENPQYKMWANFKPGSLVRWVSTNNQGKASFTGEATLTLKKVTAESVIVEMKLGMNLADNKASGEPQDIEVAARVSPELAPKTENLGQEDVQVGEKKFSCRKIQTRKTTADGTITITSWISDELPGGLAKSVTVVADKDGAEISQRTIQTVEFKIEK